MKHDNSQANQKYANHFNCVRQMVAATSKGAFQQTARGII